MQIQFENAHCWQKNKEDAETVPRLTLESLLLHLSTSFICSSGFLFMNSQLVHVLIIEVTQGCSGHPFAFISPLVLKEAKANDWCEQPLLAWLKNWPRNETNIKLQVTAFKRGCLTSGRLENGTTSQVSPVSQRKLNCSPVLFYPDGAWEVHAGRLPYGCRNSPCPVGSPLTCLCSTAGLPLLSVFGRSCLRNRSDCVYSQFPEEPFTSPFLLLPPTNQPTLCARYSALEEHVFFLF